MQEHEKWFSIAHEDLAVARLVLRREFFSTVAYHAQQAAEKSLKGYLCYKQQSIMKTHDLIKLLEECMKHESKFKALYPSVRQLNPFATKFRYPTEFDIPDVDEAKLSIRNAARILRFCVKEITRNFPEQLKINDI